MGEILTALIMIGVALGPFPKRNSLEGSEPSFEYSKYNHSEYLPENIVWTTAPGIKKATLTQNGITQTTFYNWHNQLVATTQLIEIKDLPPVAMHNLIKGFPGYQMGEITKYTSTEVFYFINLKNEKENFLVKVTPDAQVHFLQNVSEF